MKLCENGFGVVWFSQGVGDMNVFIRVFRERLIDCRWQDWNSHVHSSTRFDMYGMINTSHCLPTYMSMRMDSYLKRVMTRFRFGVSDIFVHHYRYKQLCPLNLVCPMCGMTREDEIHFVLTCPRLADLREQFLLQKYFKQSSLFKLVLLMSSSNENVVKRFILYLNKAFKRRNVYLT